jgi:hypothetical protein
MGLSVLTYNVNGCGDRKRADVFDSWKELFSTYDLVLLQETRSVLQDPLRDLLAATHQVVSYNALEHGSTAGYGLAVYYRRGMQVTASHVSDYVIWVRVQVGQRVVMVACVYVPLDRNKGDPVWDHLQASIHRYQASGAEILVAGDLNAHVGGREDRQMLEDGSPAAEVCPRGVREGEVENAYGAAVLELCQATGLVLLTGRGPGCQAPQEVAISYAHNNGSSRPDHVLCSLEPATWVCHTRYLSVWAVTTSQ